MGFATLSPPYVLNGGVLKMSWFENWRLLRETLFKADAVATPKLRFTGGRGHHNTKGVRIAALYVLPAKAT